MKKFNCLISIILFIFLNPVWAANTSELSPIGLWKTIDDVSGKPKAIVQIFESSDKSLYGRILKVFPRPGVSSKELCTACEGTKHNQPILGMVIMENLLKNKDNNIEWNNGNILDPKSGKTYHCTLQLAENGKKLNIRGYIGLPLFGRSQTWERVSDNFKHSDA